MEIEELWGKYSSLLLSTFDGEDCYDNVKMMLDELGERLINLAMQTASKAARLIETYDMQFGPSKRSVVKIALLHDLGKVGVLRHDHFVVQDSDWHREKQGAHYKLNDLKGLQKMTISHRTLYLLQHFGIKLDQKEWLGIQLAQGFHFEENRWYVHGEPELAMIIQHAKHAVTRSLSIHDSGLRA